MHRHTAVELRLHEFREAHTGGKFIRLEVHYTPNGKPAVDKTMVGFTLAKTPAQRRFVIMAPDHLADMRKPIPAGSPIYQTRGELKFKQDVDLPGSCRTCTCAART
jgi:hypothetical protein